MEYITNDRVFQGEEQKSINRYLERSYIKPRIEMLDDYCIIEWVECYNNYGLYRCKYQISRKDYSVSKISVTSILSIKPTFMY